MILSQGSPRRKPGPKPKGDRSQVTARLPREHRELYEQHARAQGLTLGDYLAMVLAEAHGLPEPAYVDRCRQRVRQQGELPLAAGQ